LSNIVQRAPGANSLRQQRIGMPVVGVDVNALADNATYLLAGNAQVITSQVFPVPTFSGSIATNTKFAYVHAEHIQVLLFEMELHVGVGAATENVVGINITINTGSIAWLPGGNTFDGTQNIQFTSVNTITNQTFQGFLDVTALTPGTLYEINVNVAQGVKNGCNGLARLHVCQVPLGYIDPDAAPTTEVGLSSGWARANQPVTAGTASTAVGWQRLTDTIDKARRVTRYWQLSAPEDVNNGWLVGSSSYTALPFTGSSAQIPTFRFRMQRFHKGVTNSDHTLYKLWLRYKASATSLTHIRFRVTPVGGAQVDTEVPPAGWTPSGTAFESHTSATFALGNDDSSCAGTDQEIDFFVDAKIASGTIRFTSIALMQWEG
jgi:hypothetical protein